MNPTYHLLKTRRAENPESDASMIEEQLRQAERVIDMEMCDEQCVHDGAIHPWLPGGRELRPDQSECFVNPMKDAGPGIEDVPLLQRACDNPDTLPRPLGG